MLKNPKQPRTPGYIPNDVSWIASDVVTIQLKKITELLKNVQYDILCLILSIFEKGANNSGEHYRKYIKTGQT